MNIFKKLMERGYRPVEIYKALGWTRARFFNSIRRGSIVPIDVVPGLVELGVSVDEIVNLLKDNENVPKERSKTEGGGSERWGGYGESPPTV